MINSLSRVSLLASASLIVSIGACGAVGIWTTTALTDSLTNVERSARMLENHMTADMMHDAISSDTQSALLSRDPAAQVDINAVRESLNANVAEFQQRIEANIAIAKTPEERAAFLSLRDPLNNYAQAATRIADLTTVDPNAALTAFSDFRAQYEALKGVMEAATDTVMARVEQDKNDAAALSQLSTMLMSATLALTFLIVCGLVYGARRHIIRPILELTESMNRLRQGDLEVRHVDIDRKDEIGDMARAIHDFRLASEERFRLREEAEQTRQEAERIQREKDIADRAAEKRRQTEAEDARKRQEEERFEREEHNRLTLERKLREAEEAFMAADAAKRQQEERQRAEAEETRRKNEESARTAELEKRQAEEARRREIEAERERTDAIARAAAEAQAQVVSQLAQGLSLLAAGDLTFEIDTPLAEEYESLRHDFNNAVGKLREAIVDVADNVIKMRNGTQHIVAATDDFARRTEQQAASLEETAAALEEITATVGKSSDSARGAATLVSDTCKDAEQGGEVVRAAISAMKEIEASAQQISQIIGVIDEIAFQTNLLALNAGVEAARAGEAGRGFAVVASEVRALAQRSAESAKEIKALIQSSAGQVNSGSNLVQKTGQSLTQIIQRVSEIDAVVSEIASSAGEQSTGLREVNIAIGELDNITQSNAAMVEEQSAAGHSLLVEASALEKLVQRFKLSTEAVTPLRRTA